MCIASILAVERICFGLVFQCLAASLVWPPARLTLLGGWHTTTGSDGCKCAVCALGLALRSCSKLSQDEYTSYGCCVSEYGF